MARGLPCSLPAFMETTSFSGGGGTEMYGIVLSPLFPVRDVRGLEGLVAWAGFLQEDILIRCSACLG